MAPFLFFVFLLSHITKREILNSIVIPFFFNTLHYFSSIRSKRVQMSFSNQSYRRIGGPPLPCVCTFASLRHEDSIFVGHLRHVPRQGKGVFLYIRGVRLPIKDAKLHHLPLIGTAPSNVIPFW